MNRLLLLGGKHSEGHTLALVHESRKPLHGMCTHDPGESARDVPDGPFSETGTLERCGCDGDRLAHPRRKPFTDGSEVPALADRGPGLVHHPEVHPQMRRHSVEIPV